MTDKEQVKTDVRCLHFYLIVCLIGMAIQVSLCRPLMQLQWKRKKKEVMAHDKSGT